MCIVVNKHKEEFDIYIGRGSKWGNPFTIGKDGDRDCVVVKHKEYFWKQIKDGVITIDDLISLKDKRLGCFCKPLACHGDTIALAVDWAIKYRSNYGLV